MIYSTICVHIIIIFNTCSNSTINFLSILFFFKFDLPLLNTNYIKGSTELVFFLTELGNLNGRKHLHFL